MTAATNTQPSSKPAKASLPESTLDWFKTNAIAELEMRFVPSVQVALRNHLRASYWMGKCRPLTQGMVDRACKAISCVDAPEGAAPIPIARAHIEAVLCPDLGFAQVIQPDSGEFLGWSIPDLKEQLERADKSYREAAQARSDKASKGGKAKAALQSSTAPGTVPHSVCNAQEQESTPAPNDPGNPDF